MGRIMLANEKEKRRGRHAMPDSRRTIDEKVSSDSSENIVSGESISGNESRASKSAVSGIDEASRAEKTNETSKPRHIRKSRHASKTSETSKTSRTSKIFARLRGSRKARFVFRALEMIVVVAAVCILISTFFISVLQIRGSSMEPTFKDGDLVVANHSTDFQRGDVMAFYYNNKVLLKRVIGLPGDWVDIRDDGTVLVNNKKLQEDYVQGISLAGDDMDFPYQVPENRFFVLGDHRNVSVDSRSGVLGTVSDEQVLGKALFTIWPLVRAEMVR